MFCRSWSGAATFPRSEPGARLSQHKLVLGLCTVRIQPDSYESNPNLRVTVIENVIHVRTKSPTVWFQSNSWVKDRFWFYPRITFHKQISNQQAKKTRTSKAGCQQPVSAFQIHSIIPDSWFKIHWIFCATLVNSPPHSWVVKRCQTDGVGRANKRKEPRWNI